MRTLVLYVHSRLVINPSDVQLRGRYLQWPHSKLGLANNPICASVCPNRGSRLQCNSVIYRHVPLDPR